ncbi:hypothetical protein PILCRDRAFT_14103 [Piloderma croceum F 1598]|uniref:HAMP domain-containing protein n=1 Tax=Piloderma croceum (strain F 1598) TaxID=765440 RepID=A0A0C3ALL7_PILCF|nr:hypothetical protein PILCRDRAFT_14103 [Piloderma croceum F 1598]
MQDSQGQDPFLSHLISLLSIYELGLLFPVSLPTYDGPNNWQTESILRSLSALIRRIHFAEDIPPENSNVTNAPSEDGAGEDRSSGGDTPHSPVVNTVSSLSQSSPSSASFSYPRNENPTLFMTFGTTPGVLPGIRVDGQSNDDHTMSVSRQSTVVSHTASQITSFSAPPTSHADHIVCPTCGKTIIDTMAQINTSPNFTVSSSYLPLIVPPSPLATVSAVPALAELRLLKSQLGDVARVCSAVARGDLSHKITVPVQGTVMVQLKDIINTMVNNLGEFAREMVRTDREVGMERKVDVPFKVKGIWHELLDVARELAPTSEVSS